MKALRQRQQTFVKFDRNSMAIGARQIQGDDRRQRLGRHRCQIAQIHRQGLAAYAARLGTSELKVDLVREKIGRNDAFCAVAQP